MSVGGCAPMWLSRPRNLCEPPGQVHRNVCPDGSSHLGLSSNACSAAAGTVGRGQTPPTQVFIAASPRTCLKCMSTDYRFLPHPARATSALVRTVLGWDLSVLVRRCSLEAASCQTKCGPVGCHVKAPSKPKALSRTSAGSVGSMLSQRLPQIRVLPKKSSGLSQTTAALQRVRKTSIRCGAPRPLPAACPRRFRTSSKSSFWKDATARPVSANKAFSRTSPEDSCTTRTSLLRTCPYQAKCKNKDACRTGCAKVCPSLTYQKMRTRADT